MDYMLYGNHGIGINYGAAALLLVHGWLMAVQGHCKHSGLQQPASRVVDTVSKERYRGFSWNLILASTRGRTPVARLSSRFHPRHCWRTLRSVFN